MGPIIVTGAAGFIGSNFARKLVSQTDAPVVLFDKLTYAGHRETIADLVADPRVRFVQGDIADRAAVRQLFGEARPEAIVNFAAESHVDRSIDAPSDFVRTNVTGTFELLEAARAMASGSFRFLHVSTDEVFGTLGPEGAFSESSLYAPRSPYAASKAAADHLCAAWHETYGLPVIVTNCSNNFGPFQFPEKLLPLVLLNALEGLPLPIYGDGLHVRDWLFVEDHCDGLLLALRQGKPGERYNLGGGNERTNLQLIDAVLAELERQRPAGSNPALRARGVGSYSQLKTFVADRPGHDRRYAMDASKIRQELGWAPRHDFAAGIAATVRWYLSHLDWCAAVQQGAQARRRQGLLSR